MSRVTHPAFRVHPEDQYLDLLRELTGKTTTRETRNDTDTLSVFGRQIRFDMADGFPMLTTKRVFWKGIVAELLWFLRGDTNIAYLHEHGVRIWDEWADEDGELGPVYGAQWRGKSTGIDQISNVIKGLREAPYSRRHLVDSWNVTQLDIMKLPPCHCLFQFYVGDDGRLSLQLYQRSADIFLGVPFNIASYALLLHIVARMIGREPGEFVHTFGDAHLYGGHLEQAKLQLTREPLKFPELYIHPQIDGTGVEVFEELVVTDFELMDYNSHAAIKAEVYK